ncbi:hypothetical protein AVEN_181954-1 [Araneus ventricosus]|uniref:Uncharacterized protein n=1 Tax=Araneus ventricosus TaxID=182803 RepID=A0A4Y2N4Z4_ARAVE|nr:hypothetical protein AVEN_46303-1 [Araneus ventricosus]GBN34508.1 hypothetical protein AVEN_181954-1 [Araneus ventricosus]
MDKSKPEFKYFHEKSPRLIEVKIKEGVFVEPQIGQVFQDQKLEDMLVKKKKTFCQVSIDFVEHSSVANYNYLVNDTLALLQNLSVIAIKYPLPEIL